MLCIGIVKWFDAIKGYGFIDRGNGQDIFVHFSSIKATGFRALEPGQRVSYHLTRGKNGPMAINVTPIM